MARSSQSYWAIAFGMIAWSLLLFSPLAFVSSANAQETDLDYGTVIGIVSHT
jgi:heat shock protein 5